METAATTLAAVRARLPATSSNFWSDDDLIEAYNDALDELSEATEFYELNATVPRRKWHSLTDLSGILPEEVIRITAVWNMGSQRWMDPTTPRELDRMLGRGWEQNVDVSRFWFMRGLKWLGTYPRPGDDVSPVRVYFSAKHPHVSADGGLGYGLTAPSMLPPDFDSAIEEYSLYALISQHRESKKAMEHYQAYLEMERDLKQHVEGRITRDRIPHMGLRR